MTYLSIFAEDFFTLETLEGMAGLVVVIFICIFLTGPSLPMEKGYPLSSWLVSTVQLFYLLIFLLIVLICTPFLLLKWAVKVLLQFAAGTHSGANKQSMSKWVGKNWD